MSKEGFLTELRLKLDDAITYGDVKTARMVACQGLREAQEKGALGEIQYFQGQICILMEEYSEAIVHFDRAIQLNPQDGAAFNDRALCMLELGIIDDSLPYFDGGIAVEPDFATIHHNKGWLLNKIGRYTEAIACFKKALELDPCRAVTYENLADAYLNLRDPQNALIAFQDAFKALKPGFPDIARQIVVNIEMLKQEIKAKEESAGT